MRAVFRGALSLALLTFVSCDSPAQDKSPTSLDATAKAVAPTSDPTSVEAGFADNSGLASDRGVAGQALSGANVGDSETGEAERTAEGRVDAVTSTPPAATTPEEPAVPHTTARTEIPPVDFGQEGPQGRVDPRDDKIFELTERVAALQTEIEELKLRLRQLETLEQRVANLQLSVDGLATAEGGPEAGRRALGAMSESPQLRGEIAEKLQGKVRLVNNTGSEQVVYINGTPWTVLTGKSFVYTPVGKVSFQFIGSSEPVIKGIQEWQANPANDEMELVFDLSAGTGRSVVTRRQEVLDPGTGGQQ